MSDPKIAIVHDYLVQMRGGERVLVLLSEIFPEADIFVPVFDKRVVPDFVHRNVKTSFIQNLPLSSKLFPLWVPLYPYAIERFDLRGYDLVISSSSGFAQGVLTQPETCHICYSHSPFRYVWSYYHALLSSYNPLTSLFLSLVLHKIRNWDQLSSQRVDFYIANSDCTRQRIKKFYKKEAFVIYPPIDTQRFKVSVTNEDYYLIVSALIPYKKIDIAIAAFNHLGLPLKVIGHGSEYMRLRKMACQNIEFLGKLSDDAISQYYSKCKAFIFPTEEDFGIAPLEAQASGRPVIAYGRGGVLETVIDGETGIFFKPQTSQALIEAIGKFNANLFDPLMIRKHSTEFDISIFKRKMKEYVLQKFEEYRKSVNPDSFSERHSLDGGF